MTARSRLTIAAGAACAALLLAAPVAAQCWSGDTSGQGVPRESLLVTNRAPFAVNVMAWPAGGARRILGQVPPGTTRSFASVLPPGRNETTVWVDPADQEQYKLPSARINGTIVIANRGDLTCRRAAQLDITPTIFAARQRTTLNTNVARRTDLSRLAPAAGPRRAAARTPAATTTPTNSMVGRQPGPPTVVRY